MCPSQAIRTAVMGGGPYALGPETITSGFIECGKIDMFSIYASQGFHLPFPSTDWGLGRWADGAGGNMH